MAFLPPNRQCESIDGNIKHPNQWPGLILSSSTTGLLTEGALLPLHQLSNASISRKYDKHRQYDGSIEQYLQLHREYEEFQVQNNGLWKLGEIVNNDVRLESVINSFTTLPFSEYLYPQHKYLYLTWSQKTWHNTLKNNPLKLWQAIIATMITTTWW